MSINKPSKAIQRCYDHYKTLSMRDSTKDEIRSASFNILSEFEIMSRDEIEYFMTTKSDQFLDNDKRKDV